MGQICDYIIHPQPGISDEQIAKTDAAIRKILGPDNTIEQVWATSMRPTYLLFWLRPLTEREVDEVRKLDGVGEDPRHTFLLMERHC